MANIVADLNKKYAFREFQIGTLYDQIISPINNDETFVTSIYLFGAHAVGKTCIIQDLLASTNTNSGLINCAECYSQRILFTLILMKLTKCDSYNKVCDSELDFVMLLKKIFEDEQTKNIKQCIILKNCDLLQTEQLQFFYSLPKIMKCENKLFVVFISSTHNSKIFLPACVKIYFPRYSKEELLRILSHSPLVSNSDVLQKFLSVFVPTFYSIYRDLSELTNLLKMFSEYINHIHHDFESDRPYLMYKVISPFLKKVLDEVSSTTVINLDHGNRKIENHKDETQILKMPNVDTELPYFSRYLLISSYLSSVLSPKEDSVHFLKCGPKRKKIVHRNIGDKTLKNALDMKTFNHDRLIATFMSIINNLGHITSNLSSQIASLVDIRLLHSISENCLDKPQYKYNGIGDSNILKNIFK